MTLGRPGDGVSKLPAPVRIGVLRAHQVTITASEWHRAAIIAAYVTLSKSRAHLSHVNSDMRMSATQFAALGIVGLSTPRTVRKYARAWATLNIGRPIPGESVEIEKTPAWPTHNRRTTP